jgi:hypothetical protein
VAKQLESVKASQESWPSHLDADYDNRIREMASAIESLRLNASAPTDAEPGIRRALKDIQTRLEQLEAKPSESLKVAQTLKQ